MTCSQLLHLHHILNHTDLINLEIITALIDNEFPVEKWEKDGCLEGMVKWVEGEYEDYGKGGHRGGRDIDDFLYCVADVAIRDGLDLDYPMYVDMGEVYDLLDIMD